MAKPDTVALPDGSVIPILYEDRSVLAIDKPAGWLLAPNSWERTARNLQLALESSIRAGEHWARARNIKFLRYVHRLDADTSGVLLLVKSPGALKPYTDLFESRQVEKTYLAVIEGKPPRKSWVCRQKIGPDPRHSGRMIVDARYGKVAETRFRVLSVGGDLSMDRRTLTLEKVRDRPNALPQGKGAADAPSMQCMDALRRSPVQGVLSLLEAFPLTGRTHQIRVHLQASGFPIVGDRLYGGAAPPQETTKLGLRAIRLSYHDPFSKRPVHIEAPSDEFTHAFGF